MGTKKLNPKECSLCGGLGTVPRAYIEPGCDAIRAREKVECPKAKDHKTLPEKDSRTRK